MNPEEILRALEKQGVRSSRATLLRYEAANLIPGALRGSGGRGHGKFSDYPDGTVAEYIASTYLIKSLHATNAETAAARNAVLIFCNSIDRYDEVQGNFWNDMDQSIVKIVSDNVAPTRIHVNMLVKSHVGYDNSPAFSSLIALLQTKHSMEWWELRQIAEGQIDQDFLEVIRRIDWKNQRSNIDMPGFCRNLAKLERDLSEVCQGLRMILSLHSNDEFEPGDNIQFARICYWLLLEERYPDLSRNISNSLLANFPEIPSKTFEFLQNKQI